MSKSNLPLTAQAVDEMFVKAMNVGDLDKAMSLYHPDAVFVPEPGQAHIRGLANLREHLKKFIDMKPKLQVEVKQFIEAGDVAFYTLKWQLSGTSTEGETVSMSCYDGNVVQRQSDGSWKIMIDNPFHSEHVGLS